MGQKAESPAFCLPVLHDMGDIRYHVLVPHDLGAKGTPSVASGRLIVPFFAMGQKADRAIETGGMAR
ncbi:hypothetical protein Asbog_00556 [Asaia bogorensis NBRC 16594]|nr:hypothetical protein Asbog_00556 [Asaia bogorensis NBRC 16594]